MTSSCLSGAVQLSDEFTDRRLVAAVYDTINAYDPGTQPDFYAGVAEDLSATAVLDVGCGTGLITCELARRGYRMVGVDPSSEMISRARDACSNVEWRVGGLETIGPLGVDLAMMSGHVAQFFISDDQWADALVGLHRAIRPGGSFAFETRDPRARAWARWTSDASRVVTDPRVGEVECWSESHEMVDGVVSYSNHYRFGDSEDVIAVSGRLRFRTEVEIRESLTRFGFEITALYGDWDRRPVGSDTQELIVVAKRGDR